MRARTASVLAEDDVLQADELVGVTTDDLLAAVGAIRVATTAVAAP